MISQNQIHLLGMKITFSWYFAISMFYCTVLQKQNFFLFYSASKLGNTLFVRIFGCLNCPFLPAFKFYFQLGQMFHLPISTTTKSQQPIKTTQNGDHGDSIVKKTEQNGHHSGEVRNRSRKKKHYQRTKIILVLLCLCSRCCIKKVNLFYKGQKYF